MAVNRVCWWEIGAKDGTGLAEFYSKGFGWKATEFNASYRTLDSGDNKGDGIGGGIYSVEGKCAPYQTMYVNVADVDAMALQLVELGAQSLGDPFDVPGVGRIAMLHDPEGNTLGLIKPAGEDETE